MKCGALLVAALAAPLPARPQQPAAADMPQEMVWVDRGGRILGRVGAVQQSIFFPEFSPDERSIAVSARDGDVNDRDIWIHEVASGAKKRVTSAKGNDNFPIWSPDGRQLVFTSSRGGSYKLYLRTLKPDAPETLIYSSESAAFPRDWSPDGKQVLYAQPGPAGRSLFLLRMSEGYAPAPFLQKQNSWHDAGKFSPDGKYVAYASNAAGPWEVYVAAVDAPAKVWKVSRELSAGWVGGGGQPQWRADGKELFYIMGNDTLLSVEVDTSGEFTHGPAKRLFSIAGMKGNFPEEASWLRKYDAAADGQKFVFVRTVPK
jgi:Tol biopolymer transport system component